MLNVTVARNLLCSLTEVGFSCALCFGSFIKACDVIGHRINRVISSSRNHEN